MGIVLVGTEIVVRAHGIETPRLIYVIATIPFIADAETCCCQQINFHAIQQYSIIIIQGEVC